jgi:hypothetical protein
MNALPTQNQMAPDPSEQQLAGGMKLSKWAKLVGISRTSAWRFRREGKLPVVVRYGTAYVTAATIRDFFVGDGSKVRTGGLNRMPG